MEKTAHPQVDSKVFQATVAHSDVFLEMLSDFLATHNIPAPPEPSATWTAWDIAQGEAHTALVSVIDYHCARRVLAVLAVQQAGAPESGG